MVIGFGSGQVILLDCCSLLNLYATQRMVEILQTLPGRRVVAKAVVGEAIYVLRSGDGDDAAEQEPVDIQPLIAAGLLEVWQPETEAEFASYVSFAVDIDDGEAMTCALALHRSGIVVTDDRKTLRVLPSRAPQVAALTTTRLLKFWAETVKLDTATLRVVLIDIQAKSRFTPGKSDPLLAWWEDVLQL